MIYRLCLLTAVAVVTLVAPTTAEFAVWDPWVPIRVHLHVQADSDLKLEFAPLLAREFATVLQVQLVQDPSLADYKVDLSVKRVPATSAEGRTLVISSLISAPSDSLSCRFEEDKLPSSSDIALAHFPYIAEGFELSRAAYEIVGDFHDRFVVKLP